VAKLSVEVIVGGRTYPLSVDENEEGRVLNAAKDINNAIKLLQDNYDVKDMQDLLAMTALQIASKEATSSDNGESTIVQDIEDRLKNLSDELDTLS
jgi:cell division protein ZapA